jgi:hypothetical protein
MRVLEREADKEEENLGDVGDEEVEEELDLGSGLVLPGSR